MKIASVKVFHEYVGRTIMFCQCIEHDVKWIYAGMLSGDHRKNFDELEKAKETLGAVICKIQDLDYASGKPNFSADDYKLLKEITWIRNYWAHTAYAEFVYKYGKEWQSAFFTQCQRLEQDFCRLERLSKNIENVRLIILKKYGRIR